jgi:hypothetical protein
VTLSVKEGIEVTDKVIHAFSHCVPTETNVSYMLHFVTDHNLKSFGLVFLNKLAFCERCGL